MPVAPTPEELREIVANLPTPRKALSIAVGSTALVGTLASYATVRLGFSPILAAPLLALSLTVLSIVLHDCAHGTLFPSRTANALVGTLAGLLTWTPFLGYRRGHDAHHAWVGGATDRDPTASPLREVRPNRILDFLLAVRVVPVFYWAGVYIPYLLYDFRPTSGGRRAAHLAQTTLTLLAIIAVHGGLALWLGWSRYGVLAALGFLGWGILYEQMFTLNQHVGLLPTPADRERYSTAEQVNFSRSVRLPLSGLFLHFNLHKEHHLFPALNFQLLPKVHAALQLRRPDLVAYTEERIGALRQRRNRAHLLLTPTAGDR